MPSTSRPRGFSGGSNTSGSGRPVPTNTPMSERQQMALLMQMTSSSNQPELSPGGHSSARGRDKNGRGESALHVAAIKGDHDAVKKLLDQGMSPNLADNAGWTPLHEACNHGHYNVAALLIKAELSPGGHSSARGRDKNGRGESALHVAAIKGDHDAVKKLLDQGMSPNLADNAGWTPLHEACNHGHYNVAALLIKAGANVNAKGYEDVTPLHDAALDGQLKLVKLLVERGADPTSKNQKGKTPCDIAAPAVYNYLKVFIKV
uniref:Uncharacterized protein n=1 Tax=Lutzomyia longipalpis TaxID=7200 RepID=A0A1B0GJ63_LUTLO